jgi:hypothetical protein
MNKLYPPKKESTVNEIVTALLTTFVCFFIAGVIIFNFSTYNNVSSKTDDNINTNDISQNDTNEEIQQSEISDDSVDNDDSIDSDYNQETTELSSDYIIADSDKRLITESDLEYLTAEQIRYARNEIYARHGRLFDDPQLQAYFNSKQWYNGTISPDDFDDTDLLNDIEKQNRDFIVNYEKTH